MLSLFDITYDIYEATQDPANPDAPPAVDPTLLKKYILYTKLKELNHYLGIYSNNLEDIIKAKQIQKITFFIGIVLNFFDLFDYDAVKSLSVDVLDTVETTIKGFRNAKSQKKEA